MQHQLIIKYWRNKRGLSQEDLAAATGTSQSYISELEKNTKSPTVRMLFSIADALEICPKLLIKCNHKDCEYCGNNDNDC